MRDVARTMTATFEILTKYRSAASIGTVGGRLVADVATPGGAQQNKGPPNAVQGFSTNRDKPVTIKAASLEVRVRPDAERNGRADALVRRVAGLPGVADVRYDREWLARVASGLNTIRHPTERSWDAERKALSPALEEIVGIRQNAGA